MAAQEDVLVECDAARHLDDGVDVPREDEIGPVGEERHVVLRVVEDRTPRQARIEGQAQLLAEEPVLCQERVEGRLCDIEPRRILELVGATVDSPHLEHEIVLGLGARQEILGEDAEVVGAAEEAGDEDEDGIRLRAGIIQLKARVAGVVQADAGAELRQQLGVGDHHLRTAGRIRWHRAAGYINGGHRRAGAGGVAQRGTARVVGAVALFAEIQDIVAAIVRERDACAGIRTAGSRSQCRSHCELQRQEHYHCPFDRHALPSSASLQNCARGVP